MAKKKTIKPWTMYVWQNGKNMEGAAPVVTKDGLKHIYRAGWKLEKDPESKKNKKRHQVWRARINVKNLLNNTLNVINWYGKKALDENYNVDTKKFDKLEKKTADEAVKVNYIEKYGNKILNKNNTISSKKLQKAEKKHGKMGDFEGKVDMSTINPIKNYPIKDITKEEAEDYELI